MLFRRTRSSRIFGARGSRKFATFQFHSLILCELDLDILTCTSTCIPKMEFLGHGFRKLKH